MATKDYPLEPSGFGLESFGNPSDDRNEKEYGKGFGDPKTQDKTPEDNQK